MIKQTMRTHLQTTFSETALRQWFDPLTLRLASAKILEIFFPHPLFADWFDNEKRILLQKEAGKILHADTAVVFATMGAAAKTAPKDSPRTGLSHNRFSLLAGNSSYSFAAFVYNRKNDFPIEAAKKFAQTPDNPPCIPFVIRGKGTCGKTHLLRATAFAMASHIPHGSIYLGSAADIFAEYDQDMKNFIVRKELLSCDAIFIDDFQYMASSKHIQQELIYIADQMLEMKKPLILAMDGDDEYVNMNPKLRSRLEAGLVVTLQEADIDVRLRFAKQILEKNSSVLKKNTLLHIVRNVPDMRRLEGTLAKIAAFKKTTNRNITDQDIETILRHADGAPDMSLTPDSIVNAVAEQFSLTKDAVLGMNRRQDILLARQISMFLCREWLGLSFPAIGAFFQGKNHATILHAYKKILKLQNVDKNIHKFLTNIQNNCS